MLYRMMGRIVGQASSATGTLITMGAAIAIATFALRMAILAALIVLAVLLVILVVRLVRIARQPQAELEPAPIRLVVDEEAIAHRNRIAATLAGTRHTDLIPPVHIHRACPSCKVLDDHLIAATRHGYRRECRWCRHTWHEAG